MNKNLSPLRPAMTAIAAVIALSSTAVLAQSADSTADQAAPVVVAPPAPTVTAAPADAATPSPEIANPMPAMKTVGTPVVHEADAADALPPARNTVARHENATPATHKSSSTATPAIVPAKAESAPTPIPAPVAKSAPAVAAENIPAVTAAAAPQPASPAPVATTTQTTHVSAIDDETLPIAGGVGLAVIALGGAAYAFSRRRREREDDTLVLQPAAAVVVPDAEPVVVAPPVARRSKIAAAGTKTLPNGFDISRFGRHTQAAYLGQTPENPSYSLKKRLKRASFFDQREREAAAAGRSIEQAPIAAPVKQAARVQQDDGQITVRLAPQRKRGGLGYLLQR